MFNKHLFKVIIGFCVVILFGLISLVVLNSLKDDAAMKANSQAEAVLPPVEVNNTNKSTIQNKTPIKKPTTTTTTKTQ